MPEIQNPEIVRNIEKRYGLKGYPGPGILSPEIVPVSIVDSILTEYNIDQHPYMGEEYIAAGGAGQYGHIQLYNPSNSGKLVIPQHVLVYVGQSGGQVNMRVSSGVTYSTKSAATQGIDTRSASSPSGQVRGQTTAAAITPTYKFTQTVTYPQVIDVSGWDLILDEGDSLIVDNATANNGINANFVWLERPRTVEDGNIP